MKRRVNAFNAHVFAWKKKIMERIKTKKLCMQVVHGFARVPTTCLLVSKM